MFKPPIQSGIFPEIELLLKSKFFKFVRFCNLFEISGDQLLEKTGVWFKHVKENPTGKQVKITEVSLEEIKEDPTMRLDAKYWIKKKEEDEQKKD